MTRWSVPSLSTWCRTHSMLTAASATRGALTTSQAAGVRPAFSNSSASGGWFLEDSYIAFERGSDTMLITNSSVSTMLFRVSLVSGGRSTRGPKLMQSIAGLREATVKKLNGARLHKPFLLSVEVQAIGRGTTEPTSSL